jgi:hypothetical protein
MIELHSHRRFIVHAEPWSGWRQPAIPRCGLKPPGMWYALGDAWLDWCRTEQPGWVHRFTSEVELDTSSMLMISDVDQFDAFDHRWHIDDYPEINWPGVMETYSGLEISPYLHERRLESLWYYIWDCASGVIWRPDALISRTLVHDSKATQSIAARA